MQSKTFTEFWAGLPFWVKLIIYISITIAVVLVIRKIQKYFSDKRKQELLEKSIKNGLTDSGAHIQINLGTKASTIHSAFYDNDWFSMTENEELAMSELLSVPKSMIPDLSAIYYNLYKKNIKEEFQKYLSVDNWSSVQSQFN